MFLTPLFSNLTNPLERCRESRICPMHKNYGRCDYSIIASQCPCSCAPTPSISKYIQTDYKNQRVYLAIPVGDIKGLMILNNVLSCFRPSYRSVQISPRFLLSLDPLALGPSGPHASGSKLHFYSQYDKALLQINSAIPFTK